MSGHCSWNEGELQSLGNKRLNSQLLSTVFVVHERKSPLHKTSAWRNTCKWQNVQIVFIKICNYVYSYAYINIHAYKYVYVSKIHTEICRHIYTYMEGKLGVLGRMLHIIRSWMHAHPANKAITQLEQCRSDGLLVQMLSFRIMQPVAGGESWSVCGAWFVLPHGGALDSGRVFCSLPLLPPSAQVSCLKEPGCWKELRNGLWWECTLPCQRGLA